MFLALCCFVVTGILLCRFWRLGHDRVLEACVVGLFVIHPYHGEIFTFREATLCVGLAILLATGGIVLADRRPSRWLGGCAMLVLALSLYQVAFNYAAIALAIYGLFELSRSEAARLFKRPFDVRHPVIRQVLPRALALAASAVVYFLIYRFSQLAIEASTADRRSQIMPLSYVPERVQAILETIWRVLALPEAVMPLLPKLLAGVIAVLAVFGLARRASQTPDHARGLRLAVMLLLLVAAVFAIVGVLMPLIVWWPVDRVLSAASVLFAGLLALAAAHSGARRVALVAACCCC